MEFTELPIVAELGGGWVVVTDADVKRVGDMLPEMESGEEPLGVIHSEEARKLWAMADLFDRLSTEAFLASKFHSTTKEQATEWTEAAKRHEAFEEITRALFWTVARSDIGGKAWGSTTLIVRSGWMVVATSKRQSLASIMARMGVPPPQIDPNE